MPRQFWSFPDCFSFYLRHTPLHSSPFSWERLLLRQFFCFKQAGLNRPRHYIVLVSSVLATFLMVFIPPIAFFTGSFFGFICAGILGSCVMLLPGVSGSYLLHLLVFILLL